MHRFITSKSIKDVKTAAGLTCLSLKERFPLVLTFWLCFIIKKFFFRFFSLLLVLANGFSLLLFLTYSFLSVRPAWEQKTNPQFQVKIYTLYRRISINKYFMLTIVVFFTLTMAVASRVSLSDLGFLWRRSMSLRLRNSPLKNSQIKLYIYMNERLIVYTYNPKFLT